MYSLFVLAVGIGRDAAPLVGAHLVLVDHPLQGRAVSEAVVEGFGRNAGERQRGVHRQAELVLGEPHFDFDAVAERQAGRFDQVQLPGLELFVVQVQLGQLLAGLWQWHERVARLPTFQLRSPPERRFASQSVCIGPHRFLEFAA